MNARPVVSIVICTRNRAESLNLTLRCFAALSVPEGLSYELLVVDNGSTDTTAEVVLAHARTIGQLKYVHEARVGQAVARNTGLRLVTGDLIAFTDDDVRFGADWLPLLTQPLFRAGIHAVVGAVRVAPHLNHPWMTAMHRSWIASTDSIDQDHPQRLVGANMAFQREVLNKVPAFDEELGPGALGFGDDTLFSLQLKDSGFRLAHSPGAFIEHHCSSERVTFASYRNAAVKLGRTEGYLRYHWFHHTIQLPRLRLLRKTIQYRLLSKMAQNDVELMSEEMLLMLQHVHFLRQYLHERRRPRVYEMHGLVKHRPVKDPE